MRSIPLPGAAVRRLCAAAAALAACSAAPAQSLSLTAAPGPLLVGGAAQLRLDMDFSAQPTLGGGVDLVYDPLRLQFTGFSFAAGLGDDPGFRRQPDVAAGRLVGLAFGNFNGLAGPAEVGRFHFVALAEGPAVLSLAPNVAPAGDFISLQTFGPQAVAFGSAQLLVSAVPEPSAALLLLAGGLGIAWARRQARCAGRRG